MKDLDAVRAMSETVRDVPVEFQGNALLWTAWLYYEEGMTQQAVADTLRVSRATVNKLLQTARDEGIVTIRVAPTQLATVRGAHDLQRRYGLAAVIVVPADGSVGQEYARIGRAAGSYLETIVQPDDSVAICWGKTVLAMSQTAPQRTLPNLTIVQAAGGAVGAFESSTERCATNLAARFGARCVNLDAPGIVSTSALKDALMAERLIMDKFAFLRRCSKIVFSIADLGSQSTAFVSGYLNAEETQPYRDAGAVGVMAGRFFDMEGKPVIGALDARMIGITLDELRQIPERICIAGGHAKVSALHAMLVGGNATVLVTDEETAVALLRYPTPSRARTPQR